VMILVGGYGAWRYIRKQPLPTWYLRVLLAMTFAGWVATVSGWYVTEIGRQPWLVQGVLLARNAVAELPPAHLGLTLTAYLVTYGFLLVAFIATLFHLSKKEMESAPRQLATSVS